MSDIPRSAAAWPHSQVLPILAKPLLLHVPLVTSTYCGGGCEGGEGGCEGDGGGDGGDGGDGGCEGGGGGDGDGGGGGEGGDGDTSGSGEAASERCSFAPLLVMSASNNSRA